MKIPVVMALFSFSALAQPLQWVKVGGPIGGLGYNIRIHPTDKNVLFVTDAWSGVNKSTDSGKTWAASNTGITTRVGPSLDAIPVFSLTVDKTQPNILWAGTQGVRGIFKSTDGGITWAKKETGISENDGLTIRNFEIHPTDPNTVFAAGELSVGVQGTEFDKVMGVLYKTTNGGDSWAKILQDSSLFRWMCISTANPQAMNLFTGIFDREALNVRGKGVLRTNDGGATWIPLNSGIEGSLFVGGMSMVGPTIVIGTGNYTENSPGVGIFGGVFLTTNAGGTWTRVLEPQSPGSPGNPDNVFTATAIAPSNTNVMYAGNALAFYRSTNRGVAGSWTRYAGPNDSPYGPPGVRAGVPIEITVDKDNPDVVFINNYGGGVFKSTDGGQTWRVLGTGYTGADIHKVSVSPRNRDWVLANGRSGPFKSTNGGGDWTGLAYGPATEFAEWQTALFHPNNDSIIFLSDEHIGAILRSLDGGNSWSKVFQHPSANPSTPDGRHGAKEMVFSSSDPSSLYAGFIARDFFVNPEGQLPASFGVIKSVAGGNSGSWVAKNNGIQSTSMNVTAMAVSPFDPSLAFLGILGSGIFKTSNGGDLWVSTTNDLPSNDVFAIGISSSDANILYAGTRNSGVYRSTNGGQTWTQSLTGVLTNSEFPTKLIMAIAVHPRNDSIAFAADWRSGVYRTTDRGSTWELMNNGLSTRAINSLSISSDGLYLYAGTKGEGIFRFQTAAVNRPLTPIPLSPTNGAVNQQLAVTLTWNQITGADTYRLQVASDSSMAQIFVDDSTLTLPAYELEALSLGTTYFWRVGAKNLGGMSDFSPPFSFSTIRTVSVERTTEGIPAEFSLGQNYPNPFNPSTTIRYALPVQARVRLDIFDVLGRRLVTLVDEEQYPAWHQAQWNAGGVASGIYYYRLQASGFIETKKLILLK
ncbi:MAG: T9SS type A sorting domain-containing protein [Ignavibacteriales bacterium]|nr:T9SS type A sorting domain-containing protein [Ignavibacteriales bacterium]